MKIVYKENGTFLSYDTDNIKENCVGCGVKINFSEARYKQSGNYCSRCSGEAGKKSLVNKLTEEDLNKFFQ